MPIPTYTPGYPPDGASLGQTKATMRNNLDGTFQTVNVDHINNNGQPGSQPAGYHTIIHEVPQTTVNTVTGYNQVFSGVPGTLVVNSSTTPAIPSGGDQQLYSLTGGGVLSQLTGRSAATNGYVWIGGILLQWGKSTSASGSQSITFPVAFPTNCFNVEITQTTTGSSASSAGAVVSSSVTQTGFSFITSSGSINGFFWLAIGN
jgi:hypothetical protein